MTTAAAPAAEPTTLHVGSPGRRRAPHHFDPVAHTSQAGGCAGARQDRQHRPVSPRLVLALTAHRGHSSSCPTTAPGGHSYWRTACTNLDNAVQLANQGRLDL